MSLTQVATRFLPVKDPAGLAAVADVSDWLMPGRFLLGLSGVCLLNGFQRHLSHHGASTSFSRSEELATAAARSILTSPSLMRTEDIRFLCSVSEMAVASLGLSADTEFSLRGAAPEDVVSPSLDRYLRTRFSAVLGLKPTFAQRVPRRFRTLICHINEGVWDVNLQETDASFHHPV